MALHDPVITIKDVIETLPTRYNIIFRLVIPDDNASLAGIDQTFTIEYRTGNPLTPLVDSLVVKMQDFINKYKREASIEANPLVPSFIDAVKTRLVM